MIEYASGDGNDTVYGFDPNRFSLKITDGSEYRTLIADDNLVMSIGSGSITFVDSDTTLNIVGGTYRDFKISNTVDNTVVSGTEEQDYIVNSGANVTINAGGDNDTININSVGTLIEYKTGDGNDLSQ